MRDQISALGLLQTLDIELKECEEYLERYPREISSLNQQLKNIKDSVANSKQELGRLNEKKSEMEIDLTQHQNMIKKSEEKLFEIKTYKEYEALQKEIAESKSICSQLEEQILEEMERIENLEGIVEESELELTEKEEECEKKIGQYNLKIEEFHKTYEIKKKEKEKVASNIHPDILPLYEKIKTRDGMALALAKDEVCTGCNMNIPPQLFNEILTLNRMIQCPNCRRILYVEEAESKELRTA